MITFQFFFISAYYRIIFEAHCFQLCAHGFSQDPYIFSYRFVFPAVWEPGEAAPGAQLGESDSPDYSNMILKRNYSASYLLKFIIKNHCEKIKSVYLCSRQVLHNQLLLNPPGRERSKGRWS